MDDLSKGVLMPLEFKDPQWLDQVTTGFLSKHIGTDQQFNEQNTGLGATTRDGLMFGAYQNSLNKPSFYAAKEWKTDPYRMGPIGVQAGLLGGAVTGYGKPITPLLMPELIGLLGEHALALGFVPPVKNVTPATLALQYRKKF